MVSSSGSRSLASCTSCHYGRLPESTLLVQAEHLAQRVRLLTASLKQVEQQDQGMKKDIAVARRCVLQGCADTLWRTASTDLVSAACQARQAG